MSWRLGLVTGVVVALAAFFAVGCKPRAHRTDLPKELVAQRWVEPGMPEGAYLETDRAMSEGLAVALGGLAPPPPGPGPAKPLNILALSAGGKYGAYTAGVLAGWQNHGDRPCFDVVTGVSSGAIIAIYAFLGPQYDWKLKQLFTETESKDLYKVRPARELLLHGAFATAKPMRDLIEREINHCLIDEIRAAHLEGRRLFLATLGVQSKRLVTWDLGAIACSGRPDADHLVRQVVLAAAAIPGILPPIEFDVIVNGCRYKEAHADGGSATQIFVKLAEHQACPQPGKPWLAGSRLFTIAGGKLWSDPLEARLSLFGRVGASVSASLYALYRAELCKLYALCLSSGLDFNTVALDPAFEVEVRSIQVDPKQMKKLYQSGYEQACGGVPWRKLPPGGLCNEEDVPRTGTCFVTVPPAGP